jgi:TrmH family RNA methyltransferase
MTEPITSPGNPRIKRLVRLRERRDRQREGVILLDELRVVRRALEAGLVLDEAYACPEVLAEHGGGDLLEDLRRSGIEIVEVTPRVLEKAAYRAKPEGLIAVARPPAWSLDTLALPPEPLVLVLEGVEKPGNLGAVVRTASGAGVAAVLACGAGADPWNPNALRASTGAVFTVPTVSSGAAEILDFLRERGIPLLATTPAAPDLHTACDLTGPVAVLLGAEDTGLSSEMLAAAGRRCRIPMLGTADSLNVSVAAALLAYEALRQRSARR